MKAFVEQFSEQLLDALDRVKKINLKNAKSTYSCVVISGLGGSGIGGSIAADFLQHSKAKIPVIINKDYEIPAYVDAKSLFIACSYSGNTEETIEAFQKALRAKAKIICITSGGALAQLAKKHKLDCVTLPTGFPPRAAIAYSLTALVKVLEQFKFINNSFVTAVYQAVGFLNEEENNIKKQAKTIAQKLHKRFPILYAVSGNEGVLVRFRQQLNENSKILACHHVIPEMNHNELVGWRDKMDAVVVIFRGKFDHVRSQKRIEVNKTVFKKYAKSIIEINAMGDTWWEQCLYFIHLGDWISVYLAEKRAMDATEVKVIDHLKAELSKT